MKKIVLALAAMAFVFSSCVKNDPYVEPKGSSLYGKLFLNEVNGTGGVDQLDANKYVELYNSTDADISLNNFVMEYGGKETWRGRAEDVVPAKGYKLIQGTKTTYPGMSQGLSCRNANVNLSLLDADGNVVDYYEKLEDLNGQPLEQMDHMRIPDGGTWYFVDISAQSPGAANLTDPKDPAVKGAMSSMEEGLKIESVTVSTANPTPDDDVTIDAKITDVNVISSVALKWKKNGTDQPDVAMTKNAGGLYEATISKQAAGTVVDWTVLATNNKGNTATETGTITWATLAADYSNLVLNEIDGIAKAIELYNKGAVAIPLAGVTLWKNIDTPPSASAAWWTGSAASGSIAPGAYVVIYQTGFNPGGADVPGFVGANGISPKQTLKFDLLDPSNQNLGEFVRGASPWQTAISDVSPNSYQRIPNGTGSWQQAPSTIGTANAASGTDIPAN